MQGANTLAYYVPPLVLNILSFKTHCVHAIKLFISTLMLLQNKLECLSTSTKYLEATPGAYPHGTSKMGGLQALQQILNLPDLQRTNTVAYFATSSGIKRKKF
jgi:hypothetical protein